MRDVPAQPPLVPLGSEDEVVEAIAQMIAREAVRRLNAQKIAAGPSKEPAAIETTTPQLYDRGDNARSDNN